MFSATDTIVAIATAPGRGAIGIVRLSGPDAQRIAGLLLARTPPLEPRHATFATITAGTLRDKVIATSFPAPASYTGDDVVEISGHGSPVLLRAIVSAAIDAGARLAEPGEFTLRAFLNGRIDLPRAEAVADLIDAVTPLQARAAFDQLNGTLTSAIGAIESALFDLTARLEASVDFPDEGYHFIDPAAVVAEVDAVIAGIDRLLAASRRGRLVREGVQIAIAGRPNAGKSSLFNALVGSHRAIVTEVPGTTRDLLTEVVDLDGLRVTLVDTAGLRESDDVAEREGVERARRALGVSDLILLVCDGSRPWDDSDQEIVSQVIENKRLIVSNKSDCEARWERSDAVKVSALTGDGLETLVRQIARALDVEPSSDAPGITNIRHIALMDRARTSLMRARIAAGADSGAALSEEFVLADLRDAGDALEEVTGRRTAEDLLAHVFQHFCIGK